VRGQIPCSQHEMRRSTYGNAGRREHHCVSGHSEGSVDTHPEMGQWECSISRYRPECSGRCGSWNKVNKKL